MTVVTVLTCPRSASYVEATLDWVDRELAGSGIKRYLICDREIRYRAEWVSVLAPIGRNALGATDNKFPGWEALRIAKTLREDLLFLEDDVVLRPATRLIDLLGYRVRPEAAWASFYHPHKLPGLYSAASFVFSQAVLIPKRTLDWITQLPTLITGDWEHVHGFDTALSVMGRSEFCRYEQAANHVDHVGLISAAHPERDNASIFG